MIFHLKENEDWAVKCRVILRDGTLRYPAYCDFCEVYDFVYKNITIKRCHKEDKTTIATIGSRIDAVALLLRGETIKEYNSKDGYWTTVKPTQLRLPVVNSNEELSQIAKKIRNAKKKEGDKLFDN